ncbi:MULTISPECIES: DUF4270 domain-containing protein [Bacteroides]|uniref:DUF4270 domain-containing protein n=1 Tax=Bacteroides TaxID=816 RepID=UPI0018996BAD|nr:MULTISPECIES: DUF4270 domain-containing protein [Bacteroides]MBV3831864.1 DUF4270 domain-containing protein [Bacteroides xylanisolvens]MBV3874910.1 DUF4270 domain-containing protein [Bacteroides xylanisolvens]MBV3880189.1 DUF4270 domain-containing protein [Bacteroides xylanisolvens]MBV3905908.1 DUF4270 domain-containing protein [Bacteroides xylanisolvens]MBV3911644.1 DUF4270 domain-containing protein [Bacteroides xylanisolvens]
MKAKYALIALLAITFWGCDDNTAGLGLGMFPGSDQDINGQLKTYPVTTSSVPAGRIYAKTNIGYVGKFTDSQFGTYQAGFLSTLNCPEGLTFPGLYNNTAFGNNNKITNTMVEKASDDITLIHKNDDNTGEVIGNIHTVELYLWYNNYFGDSLTACRLSVYELEKELEKAENKDYYYTDINPDEFYKENDILGSKAYTAVDLSVKDSIRNLSTYVPSVHLTFEKNIAERVGGNILRKFREAQEQGIKFDNEEFFKAFKGIYVKSNFGDGTVLYVDQVQMNVVYKCYAIDSIKGTPHLTHDGKDSTYYAYRVFNSTREVIQANQLDNDSKIDELIKNDKSCTYLKTPAGIFTEAVLPISKINEELSGDTLNAVKLTFSNYNQSSNSSNFGMSAPANVMLIREKEKDRFFAKNLLNDGVSSFLTSHSTSTNQYTFNNITGLINACVNDRKAAERDINEKGKVEYTVYDTEKGIDEPKSTNDITIWEEDTKWDKVVLIPVLVTYDSSNNNNYYGTSSNIIGIQHDLRPGYVKLKGGEEGGALNLEVVYTSFTKSTTKN